MALAPQAPGEPLADPRRHWLAWPRGIQRPTRYLLLAVAAMTLLVVAGLGWFQYQQIDHVTLSSIKGQGNLAWGFSKLELQLGSYQAALREVVGQGSSPALLEDLSNQYNIFVSQVQLLQSSDSSAAMQHRESFQIALAAANAYIDRADLYLTDVPPLLDPAVARQLFQDSHALRAEVHRLALDAYHVETARATASLQEIRRFTLVYGLTSTVLIVLTLWVGWLTMRRLTTVSRLQLQHSEFLQAKKDLAESANQAKSRFLSAASHDLRQPAHALGLFMSQLVPLPLEPPARHLVDCANEAVRDMQSMLDGMFDLSRLDAESTHSQIRPFAISGVLTSLRNGYTAEASAKGLRLRVRPCHAWVQSDPVLLQRILHNLVSNAIRYTRQGSVLVACRQSGHARQLHIEVRDSGIGIAPQDHERIFQEFYQVDNPQRDRRQGLGVGLSIVQRCCRLLDLPLTLRSNLGCGTTYRLSLPLASPRPTAAPEALASVKNDLANASVLVIEDDAMNRDALAGLLASWGCRVRVAEDLSTALALCQANPWPDLIVSDYRLAGHLNGLEIIQALRAQAGRELPACVISGDTQPHVTQRVREAGLVLLSKPVRPAKLRGLLRHLLQPDMATAKAPAPLQSQLDPAGPPGPTPPAAA
ncbi:response regulator [Rhodoferax sp. 4810]|nr:response regulator [Rhodoferax jenense]